MFSLPLSLLPSLPDTSSRNTLHLLSMPTQTQQVMTLLSKQLKWLMLSHSVTVSDNPSLPPHITPWLSMTCNPSPHRHSQRVTLLFWELVLTRTLSVAWWTLLSVTSYPRRPSLVPHRNTLEARVVCKALDHRPFSSATELPELLLLKLQPSPHTFHLIPLSNVPRVIFPSRGRFCTDCLFALLWCYAFWFVSSGFNRSYCYGSEQNCCGFEEFKSAIAKAKFTAADALENEGLVNAIASRVCIKKIPVLIKFSRSSPVRRRHLVTHSHLWTGFLYLHSQRLVAWDSVCHFCSFTFNSLLPRP